MTESREKRMLTCQHNIICLHAIAACEPGALELACVINAVQDIIVCGHSDCKVSLTLSYFAHLAFFSS